MSKFIAISVLYVFTITVVAAQKKSTVMENKIKAVTEYKQDIEKKGPKLKEAYTLFDEKGNVLEEIEYDSQGKVKTHMKYAYDSNSNKIKETELDPAGKVVRVHEYKYNSSNLKTERSTYDGSGKLKSKRYFQYDLHN